MGVVVVVVEGVEVEGVVVVEAVVEVVEAAAEVEESLLPQLHHLGQVEAPTQPPGPGAGSLGPALSEEGVESFYLLAGQLHMYQRNL